MGRRGNGEGEIEKLPSGKYRARRSKMVAGELVREGLTFDRRSDAAAWLGEHKDPAKPTTLAEWLDQWLTLIKPDAAPSGYTSQAGRVERHLKPRLGDVRLRDLSPLAAGRMLSAMDADGHSDSERFETGAILKRTVKSAVAHRLLPADPLAGFKLPKVKRPEKRAMTPAECLLAIDAADETYTMGYAVRLWLDAGLRPGEMFGLEWGDFDERAGVVKIRRGIDLITNRPRPTKTRKGRRTIDLSEDTVAALAAARPLAEVRSKLVMPAPMGGSWWQAQFAKRWAKIRTEAGLSWVTPYTFRHTMATLLIQANVHIKIVSERLGHEDIGTTLRTYAHVMPGDQSRAAAVMQTLLSRAKTAAEPG